MGCRNNKIIFSEDYSSKENFLAGLFYGTFAKKQRAMFGQKIFPSIVKEFINDLKANLKQNVNTAQLNEN